MARITVDDCLKNVDNRFELVLDASKRARQLEIGGADATLPWENDKPTVMALREIANGLNDVEATKPEIVIEVAASEEVDEASSDQE